MAHLKENMFVVRNETRRVWREAAQKAGRWFSRVEEREPSCLCAIGIKRRDAKLKSDTQRLLQRHSPSASLSGRAEGGRGEGGGWGAEA